jgi:peptidoglycan/LPS O-acetylase OafA/YrhL
MPNSGAMRHRPEIDGLRAIAVVPVMLFHAGLENFSGGFVGVDVFFVISGFLITSIIVKEHKAGSFTLSAFYERRIRRIIPALFVVMIACLPFALWLMRPSELEAFGKSMIAVVFFSSNILFYLESGYFDAATELKPLLHTWSLGIEEQYYLAFPIFVGLVIKYREAALPHCLAAIAIISFLISLWLANISPSANFYLIPSRAWELMAGSLLAIAPVTRARNSLALIGLALIVAPIFLYDATTPFPGWSALPPVVGTMLVIAFASPQTMVGRALTLPPMLWIGLISYSAYLWHQPLFAFARLAFIDEPSLAMMLALTVVALLLAHVTRQWVELPLIDRQSRIGTRKQIFTGAIVSSLALIAIGGGLVFYKGLPAKAPSLVDPVKSSVEGCPALGDGVFGCALGAEGAPSVILLGDSHAYALADEFDRTLRAQGRSAMLLHTSCHPVPGIYDSREPATAERIRQCTAANDRMIEKATAASVTDVIVAIRWTFRLADSDAGYDNGEGGVEMDAPFHRNVAVGGTRAEMLHRYIARLSGKSVTLLYPVPEVGWNPGRLNMVRHSRGLGMGDISTSHARFLARNREALAALDAIDGVRRVKPASLLCETDRCHVQRDGRLYYADDDHLSADGVRLVMPLLLQRDRDVE